MDAYIGEIRFFGGNFAPRGWAFCHGQEISISQCQSLYSLLGTMYGGDGRSFFKLPDLRGRMPIGAGTGSGLSAYREGEQGGIETVPLTVNQMPKHSHTTIINASDADGIGGTTQEVTKNYWAKGGTYAASKSTTMAEDAVVIENAGEGQPHENRPPYTALNFIICMQGIYPQRN
ncbi:MULTISPECIES: phage tail protein [Salegentibacter]|uniref:Phage tail protein n=1 Tax=Salegentibacter maritimus TaxID=2794347 RepID=A0ABS0TGG6_9FLAO|nr:MULTISPECIES: tail fiber protein [Salegentibacter]MBE7641097.1 phage tail protein [Salegentibacter sp. BLCTC]MBI6116571.1 phage tail protein [Salegentibacter maritimus]MBI6120149.1 phage tail protein [Salegentibacter maritimus]